MPRPSCGTIDVHTHKDGQQTFYLRMTVDGRRRRVRLGTDRAGWTMGKAMVALEEQLATVRTGTWRPPDEPDARSEADDPTFRAFASSWLEDNMLEWRPNTVNDVRWRLQSHLLPQIGEERLSTFDIPRMTAVKTAMLRESRRIADAIDSGVIERDAHNNPLRPLSNESINKCMALLAMTAERPDDGPLLPTLNGTFHNRNNVAKRVIAPLVSETNAVLSERGQPKLPDGITAHSLRKTYFTLMHYSDAIPRWLADQGGHRDPSTTLGIYTEALRGERGGYGAAFDALVDGEPPPETGAVNPGDDDSD